MHRHTLHSLASREKYRSSASNSSSHVNYRYLTPSEKDTRIAVMKQQNRLLQLMVHRLTAKLDAILEKQGVELDDVTLSQIVTEEEQAVYSAFPPGSFQRIFWQQQKDFVKGWQGYERNALASTYD